MLTPVRHGLTLTQTLRSDRLASFTFAVRICWHWIQTEALNTKARTPAPSRWALERTNLAFLIRCPAQLAGTTGTSCHISCTVSLLEIIGCSCSSRRHWQKDRPSAYGLPAGLSLVSIHGRDRHQVQPNQMVSSYYVSLAPCRKPGIFEFPPNLTTVLLQLPLC